MYQVGSFDKAGRFTISKEFRTGTSDKIRSPSRAFPFSEWNHVRTQKYFKSLSDEQKLRLGV